MAAEVVKLDAFAVARRLERALLCSRDMKSISRDQLGDIGGGRALQKALDNLQSSLRTSQQMDQTMNPGSQLIGPPLGAPAFPPPPGAIVPNGTGSKPS